MEITTRPKQWNAISTVCKCMFLSEQVPQAWLTDSSWYVCSSPGMNLSTLHTFTHTQAGGGGWSVNMLLLPSTVTASHRARRGENYILWKHSSNEKSASNLRASHTLLFHLTAELWLNFKCAPLIEYNIHNSRWDLSTCETWGAFHEFPPLFSFWRTNIHAVCNEVQEDSSL